MHLSHLLYKVTSEETQPPVTPVLSMAFSVLSRLELVEAQKKESWTYGCWNDTI